MNPDKMILIVDDTPENLTILGEFLSKYKIRVALDGIKALAIAFSDPKPDLILLDIMMPQMDGFEVCRKLKENPSTKDIPVIFISAMNEVTDKVRGFQEGAVDYVTKPFQIEEVESRIETHLALSDLRNRLKNINAELEKKVMERTSELLLAKDKAEESDRIKSYFLSLMSHELRTPMSGILGFSDFLMTDLENEEQREYASIINQSAKRLHATLDSILSFSNAESGKLKPHYCGFEIVEKTKGLLRIHESRAQEKNIPLNFRSECDCLIVKLDETMFEIIINQLISNAVKYSDNGEISTEIFTEISDGQEFCGIRVMDQGRGISDEKQSLIFEEFRQADEGRGRGFEGVGLGLTLVKKYTELMNGKIELISRVNAGSTFIVKLPVVPEESEKKDENIQTVQTEVVRQITLDSKKPKILLVEDDNFNIKITTLYISGITEYDVAKTGEDALKLVGENDYATILMDINLGQGMNGVDTTKEIKKMGRFKDTPIVAFTAFAFKEDKESFLRSGFTHYLSKPFKKNDIVELLKETLGSEGTESRS